MHAEQLTQCDLSRSQGLGRPQDAGPARCSLQLLTRDVGPLGQAVEVLQIPDGAYAYRRGLFSNTKARDRGCRGRAGKGFNCRLKHL